MNTMTLDPSNQPAVPHPPVVPLRWPTRGLAGGGLLTSYRQEHPFFLEGPDLLVEGSRRVIPVVGQGLAGVRELRPFPGQFRIGQPRGCASTLGERLPVAYDRPPERTDQAREVLPFLAAVRRLIEIEDLTSAREMLEGAPIHILSNPLVGGLRRVLAPPTVERVKKQDVDRSLEYEWLRKEGHKYQGRWVALHGSDVLAVAVTLRELRETLKTMPLTHPPLLRRVAVADV